MLNTKVVNRFWGKVDFGVGSSDCWLWIGARHSRGYGMFHTGRKLKSGKMEFAHRIAYEIVNGEFDYSLCVLHKCDNPSCVNPSHLSLGTHLENMRDRDYKKRNKPRIRIPIEIHCAIKRAKSVLTNAEIASLLNVSAPHVSRVRRGLTRNYEG